MSVPRTLLLAALIAVQCDGLSELAARYRLLCVGYFQPESWDEEEDGPWAAPTTPAWSAHPACPAQLTEASFRAKCAPHLQPTNWDEEEDGTWVAPSDLSLPTCIILFVPHILDTSAEGRMETLGALVDAVANEREKPLVYFWSEAGAQPAVEKALDVGATYPKLLLYSPRHGVGAPLQLALTVQNIQAFILKAALARLPVRPAAIDVQEIASPEPWDLRDGVAPSCADEPNYDDVPLESEI